jgi:hypothetical protein
MNVEDEQQMRNGVQNIRHASIVRHPRCITCSQHVIASKDDEEIDEHTMANKCIIFGYVSIEFQLFT